MDIWFQERDKINMRKTKGAVQKSKKAAYILEAVRNTVLEAKIKHVLRQKQSCPSDPLQAR